MFPVLPEPLLSWFHILTLLLRDNDEKALFLLLFVEEAGIPLPMPGDLVIMFAGYRASMGEMSVLEVMVSTTLAVLMGSTLLYGISSKVGRGILTKYGRFIHLDQSRLEMIERWIVQRGAIMVLVGRLTPGLRTPTSIMAGVFRIPLRQFLLYAGLSALLWSGFWTGLGFYSGHTLMPLVRSYSSYSIYVAAAAVILLVVALLVRRWLGRAKGDRGSASGDELVALSNPSRKSVPHAESGGKMAQGSQKGP